MTRQQALTDPVRAGRATATEDQVFQVGLKYDPARDRLAPGSVVYPLYRDPCGALALLRP